MKFLLPKENLKNYALLCNNPKMLKNYNWDEPLPIKYRACGNCSYNKNKSCWIRAIYNLFDSECYYQNIIKFLQKTKFCEKCHSNNIIIDIRKQLYYCCDCKEIIELPISKLLNSLGDEYEEIDQTNFDFAIMMSIDNIYPYKYKEEPHQLDSFKLICSTLKKHPMINYKKS